MPKAAVKVPERGDVREHDTWDLSPLYKSDAAWARGLKTLERHIADIGQFRGTLGRSAKSLRACLDCETEIAKLSERLQNYAFLRTSENVGDSTAQEMFARFINVATHLHEAASFIAPEIQAIPRAKLRAFMKEDALADYRFTLEKLIRLRPHILSEPEERLLAMQGEVADAAGRIFGQLSDADLTFGFVTDETGRSVELSHGSYRTLLESPRRSVRKTAFHQYYAQFEAHAHTFAATLSSSVLQDVYQARARKFDSAIEAALFGDNVPLAVYDNLIASVHANLDTVYRYLALRKKALRVSELHVYDTYVPLVKGMRHDIPYEEAARTVCAALEPLGSEYQRTLEDGLLDGRWVDRYENRGKRSGAFSAGGYAGPPYILMNYRSDVLDSMFTLAHEAGHSMHTHYSARNQPFQYYDYTIFVAEVASTFNEQLLNNALLAQAKDKKTRAYLINREIDEIRGTIVRQTMFAEFEKITHALAEAGEALTLDRIKHEYRKLLERYFGPEFAYDEVLALEALRIPHFYSAFYVYKYATGLAAAIALADRVTQGGRPERDAYLRFLSSGSSKFPLDLLRDAGVDMTKPEPVNTAMGRFNTLVDELEDLL